MPFSRSRSIESMTRSSTSWLARKAPDCQSIWSTRVVLPWSTWATMATLRRSARVCTKEVPDDRGAGGSRGSSSVRLGSASCAGSHGGLEELVTAALKRSLRSPATMCPAPATSTCSACGTRRSMCAAPSSLSRSLACPRTSSVGTVRLRAAASSRSWGTMRADGTPSMPPSGGLVGRHEPRVPVPVPPAVVALAQVLGQPGQVLGPRPVRVVGGDGVGRRLEVGEAVEALAHERPDAGHALGLDPRGDVDEHEGRGDRGRRSRRRRAGWPSRRARRRRAPDGRATMRRSHATSPAKRSRL